MSATLTVNQHWTDGKRSHVVGTITLSGSYITGGINLPLLVDGIYTSQPIVHSDVVGKGGYYGYDVGTLYEYRYQNAPYNPSPTNLTNFLQQGVLRIFLSGTELPASALPAGVLADVIKFYGIFQKY
jgi:hypothetical protein